MRANSMHSAHFTLRAAAAGRVLLSAILAAASLSGFFHAQEAHAQEARNAASQLETIKAEVLNAAVADGVSVVSSAYINDAGQLVESSFYRTGGGVRGIRMQSLLQDDAASVHAGYIETSALNPALSCDQLPPPRYAHALTMSFALLDQVKSKQNGMYASSTRRQPSFRQRSVPKLTRVASGRCCRSASPIRILRNRFLSIHASPMGALSTHGIARQRCA